MIHQVFISHSSKDQAVADKVYFFLKNNGVECFMDKPDLIAGVKFSKELAAAIRGSRIVVLIFSSNSDTSEDVLRELEVATTEKKQVIPLRIEDIRPRDLAFVLAGISWLDAFPPPLETHLPRLLDNVNKILGEPTQRPSFVSSPTEGPKIIIRDDKWHDVDYKDLSSWVKEQIRVLNSGKQLVGRTFIYRKNRYTGKYQRKLKKGYGHK